MSKTMKFEIKCIFQLDNSGIVSFKNVIFIISFSFPSHYIGLVLLQSALSLSMFVLVGQLDILLFVVSRIYIVLLENEKRLDFLCIRKFA